MSTLNIVPLVCPDCGMQLAGPVRVLKLAEWVDHGKEIVRRHLRPVSGLCRTFCTDWTNLKAVIFLGLIQEDDQVRDPRGVNTLVLVHRAELLKQWRERLRALLNVGKEIVGKQRNQAVAEL